MTPARGRLPGPARTLSAIGAVLAVALSAACVHDSFAWPFIPVDSFRIWIADPWRSAYPWGVFGAAVAAAVAHRRARTLRGAELLSIGLAILVAARFAAPAIYWAFEGALPASWRDAVGVPLAFFGLALDTWLPLLVLSGSALAGLGFVARRAAGGWPPRSVRP